MSCGLVGGMLTKLVPECRFFDTMLLNDESDRLAICLSISGGR